MWISALTSLNTKICKTAKLTILSTKLPLLSIGRERSSAKEVVNLTSTHDDTNLRYQIILDTCITLDSSNADITMENDITQSHAFSIQITSYYKQQKPFYELHPPCSPRMFTKDYFQGTTWNSDPCLKLLLAEHRVPEGLSTIEERPQRHTRQTATLLHSFSTYHFKFVPQSYGIE